MTTGRRFGAPDAQTYGIVDAVAAEGAVTAAALNLLRPLAGKDPGTLRGDQDDDVRSGRRGAHGRRGPRSEQRTGQLIGGEHVAGVNTNHGVPAQSRRVTGGPTASR